MNLVNHLFKIAISLLVITAGVISFYSCDQPAKQASLTKPSAIDRTAPDTSKIPAGKPGILIQYGRKLLANTSAYFGPSGSIAHLSKGMNCQNCHLDGGTRLFANNYASVAANYPRQNYRGGGVQTINGRIKDCFERSLNSKAPDTNSTEVQAMAAYINWTGADVKKGTKIKGSGSEKLPYLTVAADPLKGQIVYKAKCSVCHGNNGEGLLAGDKSHYTYPPLWGPDSYNDGAGMYRIGNLAGFVKNNMPFGASYKSPQLTNEEAWNVAAFINSQPRPHFDQRSDWKNLSKKPIDLPFGPYADTFSQRQHKYGPFGPMKKL